MGYRIKASGSRLIAALLLATASFGVSAIPITGGLELTGAIQLLDGASTPVTDITQATTIDFIGDFGVIMSTSGSFSTISDTLVSIADIGINPFVGPIDPFWSLQTSGFSFSLDNLVNINPAPPGIAFLLEGTGTISNAGFDDTPGFWTLSANQNGTQTSFSWNASTGVAVPEPNALLLVGIGLFGIGLVKARRTT